MLTAVIWILRLVLVSSSEQNLVVIIGGKMVNKLLPRLTTPTIESYNASVVNF
jgi:hypothetical protein